MFGNQVSQILSTGFILRLQTNANPKFNSVWLGQSYALVMLIRSANSISLLLKKCESIFNY